MFSAEPGYFGLRLSLWYATLFVLGVRQIKGRSPSVVKGQTKMESYFLTIVVLAQYAP
jgi:hypothetical protein